MIRSLHFDQQELLRELLSLHVPSGFDCDMTYGNGGFYPDGFDPPHCFDIEPLQRHVVKASSSALPVEDGAFNSVVFDPPFLTYVRGGRGHKDGKVAMAARFGGYYSYDELEKHYTETAAEAARVLRKGGVFVVKCQDIIHNHRMHCTHANMIRWCEAVGFRLKDLFVLGAKARMPGPQKGEQRHARVFHSYFLVFQKR